MKATYTKPMLAVETFSQAQSTARECSDSVPESQVTMNDITVCVWDLGGGNTVFMEGQQDCKHNGEKMGYLCYNNPSEGNYIFRS